MAVNHPATRPVIVGGCHRSGTSLVRRILNVHSRIYCGPETNFFRDFYSDYIRDPIRHARFMQAARALVSESELLEIFGSAFVSLHLRAAATAGKERWADKDPSNVLYLREWQSLLGDDWVFVHVIRNPLDTLASIKERGFQYTIGETVDDRIAYYLKYMQHGADFGGQFPDRYYRVFYERLVDSPQSVVSQLMTWLGEEFQPMQLEFNQQPHQEGLEDPKIHATTSIHGESVGRWRSILEPDEAARIAAQCNGVWREMELEGSHARAYHVRTAMNGSIPRGATWIVLSRGDEALVNFGHGTGWHFPQMPDGTYAGSYPESDVEVIAQFEALRARGAEYLVVPHTSAWWLEHYAAFEQHLMARSCLVFNGDGVCRIYALST